MLANNSTVEILDLGAWWRRNPVAVELELPETLCFPRQNAAQNDVSTCTGVTASD
jgi:hypothetical protein